MLGPFQIRHSGLWDSLRLLRPILIGRTHTARMRISHPWDGLATGSNSIGHCFLPYFTRKVVLLCRPSIATLRLLPPRAHALAVYHHQFATMAKLSQPGDRFLALPQIKQPPRCNMHCY